MDSMDFHSLSRRELQSLCKKNKIPANMTNIAMADALTALTNVIGIEEIGQSDSTMPETPLTSRRTTVRKTATKPQAVESESTQTLPRPRRATTAKKIIKEEDTMEMSETTSVNDTPAPRTGRRRVTGTSVCRKLDAQTQEVKEESKEEMPVVHAYSTRRSSRLQSAQKITESVQKRGGRQNEAVMIGVLSEEETDDAQMKSNSDAIDEVQENQGHNVTVMSPIPDAVQEDLISEDGSSSTLVSADVSSSIEEVSSANPDLMSESKDEFSEQQDMSSEVSSCINDAHVSEISVSQVTLISESYVSDITLEDDAHADQDMSFEDSKVESDELDNMEIKEEHAADVTVKSPNVSSQKTAQMSEASSLEEKINALVKPNLVCLMSSLSSNQADDMTNEYIMVESNECHEVQNADDDGFKFSFEDDFCDLESDVLKSPFDFENMKETMENISNLERSKQVAASNQVEASLECEKLDGDEMQEYQTTDLSVLNLTDATVSSPSEVASKDNQVKSDDSVKCDSIAMEEGVKVNSLLDDASTDEEDSNDESDDNDESEDDDESDDNADEIHESPIAALVKSQNLVTPLKTAIPNSRMIIEVLEDTEEINKSGKGSLKSNSKLLISGVAEQKENCDTNKGENTAQKALKKKSIRELKKLVKEKQQARRLTKMLKEMKITSDNNKTAGKEDLRVEKRSPLQMLSDNCLLGEEEK